MSVADNRISAVHETGRNTLRTRARLAGWVEARERRISSADSDAIIDAALAGAIELLEMWEADAEPAPRGVPLMRRLRNAFAEVMVAWHEWRRDRHARARRKWMDRLPAGPPAATISFPRVERGTE